MTTAYIPKLLRLLLFSKIYFSFLLSWRSIKMGRIIINFGEKKTTKKDFYSVDNKKNI